MCDFHTSLDRALEPHDDLTVNRYFMPEPLENPSGVPGLHEAWQDLGYIDETWEPASLRPLMDAIDRNVERMVRARDYFTIDGTTAYDGVEVAIEWNRPVTIRPIEFTASIETIELLVGAGLIPLCERKIPAEGTE